MNTVLQKKHNFFHIAHRKKFPNYIGILKNQRKKRVLVRNIKDIAGDFFSFKQTILILHNATINLKWEGKDYKKGQRPSFGIGTYINHTYLIAGCLLPPFLALPPFLLSFKPSNCKHLLNSQKVLISV